MLRASVVFFCFLLPSSAFGQEYFNLKNIKVDMEGTMYYMRARVVRVVDDSTMIVSLEDVMHDNATLDVLVKCDTKNLVDDQKWYGSEWAAKTGSNTFKVTEIKKGKSGRKYFVLEPKKK